ncbi:MAG: hydrogenobyrinic acid a,c-diamide synthase (glutamine-hydrolyzing) [Proteobacteria bacterium]|nr:hydrogenobyrinic acid a,c-diamide synthase (glutamine-hydrolyzing) [Pseudomonadota bacterium]MBU1717254.1 hydrogenobyrinic acid a,c-diamide synthase (glutamine-hydrolyzing) [Pseudomonadota bacterium]
MQSVNRPRGLVVAGLGGGSGKSLVSVGLAAAFARQGRTVITFKKGPDYIDAGWLSLAAAHHCYNLDAFLMPAETMLQSFYEHAGQGEIIIVEGNRGLYDGVDSAGTYSTAELAKSLGLPILLVVDCTKTTRTVAAMVLGCQQLDKEVDLRGVVLNRVGSKRHEDIVRQAVEKYTGVPVVGAIPRSKHDVFPQRHLGITPCPEHSGAEEAIDSLAEKAMKYLDLVAVYKLMADVPEKLMTHDAVYSDSENISRIVRIGVLRDAAFQFYYAENLEALKEAGAELVEINALTASELPVIDGLYIGGGFPETSAGQLSANISFRQSVKMAAAQGLPIYAECGGLIYLGGSMVLEGEDFPLVGIFPVKFGLEKRPQAHGYTELETTGDNPFYPVGTEIKGHEFRYSKILSWTGKVDSLALEMKRGVGFVGGKDGLVYNNVLALYTHIHALGTPEWAPALVAKAREYSGK